MESFLKQINNQSLEVTLAHTYDPLKHDIKGYLVSNKLDGVRGIYYNGKLYSRNMKEFVIPPEFDKDWPKDIILDGELWAGEQNFSLTGKTRLKTPNKNSWDGITYMVFDSVAPGTYLERYEKLKNIIKEQKNIKLHEFTICTDPIETIKSMKDYVKTGGEGLMVRNPKMLYEQKRTKNLLKIKPFYDAECEVLSWDHGKIGSKYEKMMGNINVKATIEGKEYLFSIGSGFTDQDRENPPEKGRIVTFQYFELTKDGSVRFPVFLRYQDPE